MRKRNLASVAVSRVSVFNCAAMCIAGVGVTSTGFVDEAAATLRAADGGCEPHWDNTIGQPGVDSSVRALTVFDDKSGIGPALYAGGFFHEAGGQSASRIAKWVGSEWSPVGEGVDGGWIRALAVFDDSSGGGEALYAGGYFTTAGGQPAIRIAKWDGSQWSPLGDGMSSGVLALAGFEGDSGQSGLEPGLYAGGFFTTAGGRSANYIARWDGSDWWPLGEGMNNTVDTLIVFDDGSGDGPALYAGGFFTTAGGQTVNHIARWDGSAWHPFTSGGQIGVGSGFIAVDALTVWNGDLIAGGSFTTAGGQTVNAIARWDGCIAPPCAPADLNCDGFVDGADLLILLGSWGKCNECPTDLNNDGVVDGADLLILLSNWG